MKYFEPSRVITPDDLLTELDEMYIVGVADSNCNIWNKHDYFFEEWYYEMMEIIASSQYSLDWQRSRAMKALKNGDKLSSSALKSSLCRKRRLEFAKKRDRLMLALIDRDGAECKKCNRTNDLGIDHIIPLSKGGGDELNNLQLLCRWCNSRKGDRTEIKNEQT